MAQIAEKKVESHKKESNNLNTENEQELRNKVGVIMNSLKEKDHKLHRTSLKSLIELIKNSSTTLISMPMLLQILTEYISTLKAYYATCEKDDIKRLTADILSLLTTLDQNPETLHWRLLGSKSSDIGFWGSDYVTHLVKDIERKFTSEKKFDTETLEIAKHIVKYELIHHSTTECVDFLIEIQNVPLIVDFVDNEDSAVTVGLYLRRSAAHADPREADMYLRTAFEVYFKFDKKIAALLTVLQIKHKNEDLLEKLLKSITQKTTQMQICLILGRLNKFIVEISDKDLRKIMMNTYRHQLFLEFAKHEKLLDVRNSEEMLNNNKKKSRRCLLNSSENEGSNVCELAFVNACANCGFSTGTELLSQLAKNSTNEERMVVIASLGFICLWDVNKAKEIFAYNSLQDNYRKAGAVLALCTARTGVIDESQPFSQVSQYLKNHNDDVKVAAITGLGISYIGSNRKEVIDALKTTLKENLETASAKETIIGITGVSLGLIALGSANEGIIKALINTIVVLEGREDKLETKAMAWFLCLGVGFCCFGKEEQCDSTISLIKQIPNKQIKEFAEIMVTACAYFRTGHVLKVQELLHICAEDLVPVKEKQSSKTKVKKSKSKSNGSTVKSSANASAGQNSNGVQTRATAAGRKSKSNDSTVKSSGNASAGQKSNGVQTRATAVGRNSNSHESHNLFMNFIAAITRFENSRSLNGTTAWKNIAEISNNSLKQAAATIGVATIGIGERVGIQMMRRMFAQQLRFCEQPVQRMAPLSIALAYLSNPDAAVVQLLTKYALHTSADVSFNSILALGLVAAGTKNEKISKFLKTIFTDPVVRRRSFHSESLSAAKIAFALVHLGKGALSLSPFAFDKQLVRETSIASMLVLIVCCMDPTHTLFGNLKFLWNFLAPCIQSRALITVDNDLKITSTTVRIGKRVDVTGKSGKRRAISGFNTLTTPVTLADDEKAEPGPQEYQYSSPILEDIVIVNKK